MKKVNRIILAVVIMIASVYGVQAQATATATATATILTAISITKDVDMNFGNLTVQPGSGGTVVLATAGSRSATGGVALIGVAGVAAASFTVSGENDFTYAITLPTSDHTISSGSNTMTVNSFVSNPSATGTLSGSGSQTLKVGATLNVAAAQPVGTYVSSEGFSVTVNYN